MGQESEELGGTREHQNNQPGRSPHGFDGAWELFERIRHCEGERIFWKMESLSASYFVFSGNYAELVKSIQYFEKLGSPLISIRDRESLRQFQRENLRLVHNFLAGAFTLVDHTRKLVNELYSGRPFHEEYKRQTNDVFSNSGLAHFVKGLRNWMVHKGIVPVMIESTLNQNEEFISVIVLDLKELRSSDDWTSKAGEYLAGLQSDPRLYTIAKAYHDQVEQFYVWLDGRMHEIHAAAFAEWQDLSAQCRALGFTREG